MSTRRLLLMIPAAGVFVLLSGMKLPPVVAAHFSGDGMANGYMPKAGYLGFMALLATALPLLLCLPARLLRRLPDSMINLPHKQYWLAPQRRDATFDEMERQMAWLAAALALLLCCTHVCVVLANAVQPPHLSSMPFLAGLAAFGLFGAGWCVQFFRRFGRPA